MWTTFFKVFMEFVTILLLLYVSAFWPWGMWDLCSSTRDWTHTPCTGIWSLKNWTIGEVPAVVLLFVGFQGSLVLFLPLVLARILLPFALISLLAQFCFHLESCPSVWVLKVTSLDWWVYRNHRNLRLQVPQSLICQTTGLNSKTEQ